MRPKVSAYIAASLDGFIARKNGDLDWLPSGEELGAEDYGYRDFIDSVDILVMGRKTYEKALTFDKWPYRGKEVVVLSTGAPAVPKALRGSVTVRSLDPKNLVDYVAEQGATHIYIDGGITIQRFISAGQLDEITITRIPVLIGEGIPLFGPLSQDVRLIHIATRQFDSGFEQSKYRFCAPNIGRSKPSARARTFRRRSCPNARPGSGFL